MIGTLAAAVIPLFIGGILLYGLLHQVDLFAAFADGAKKGLQTAIIMLPPLVLCLTVFAMFRASGALDVLCHALQPAAAWLGIPQEVIPLALLRPLSGSGSMAVFQQILQQYGPDSYIGRTASVIQSASETTFYTMAIYFGVSQSAAPRYALFCSLAGDLTVILAAAWFIRWMF